MASFMEGAEKENGGQTGGAGPTLQQQLQQAGCRPQQVAHAKAALAQLRVDVRSTPPPPSGWAPPVSCPSRLQLTSSPARAGSGASFDPFAAPAADELPGCTPMCAPPCAPPAVQRKGSADDAAAAAQEGSPAAAVRPAALFADRVQSCPPEREGRRGRRPLVRLRVKRSLNGAVAAAASSAAPSLLARRSMDSAAAAGPPPPQLAGCSRKRFEEADLVSPPMPRKSSRTLLEDDQSAADMMQRLNLAAQSAGGATAGGAANGTAGPAAAGSGPACAAAEQLAWAPAAGVPAAMPWQP